MRRSILRVLVPLAICGLGPSLHAAPCVSKGTAASLRLLSNRTDEGVAIILSMSMLPKLIKLDYATAATSGTPCERRVILVGSQTYRLIGEDQDQMAVRRALPKKGGQPIAILVPISDLNKILDTVMTHQPPPIDGYMLATITRQDLTGWQYYSAIPDDDVLGAAIKSALEGGLKPIFRNEGQQTKIFVGPKAGSVP